MKDLSHQVLQAKKWCWVTGMQTLDRTTVLAVEKGVPYRWAHYGRVYESWFEESRKEEWSNQLPDLDSPATLGCLLSLVRKAWNCPTACVDYTEANFHTGAFWAIVLDWKVFTGSTEAEALVRALVAAE